MDNRLEYPLDPRIPYLKPPDNLRAFWSIRMTIWNKTVSYCYVFSRGIVEWTGLLTSWFRSCYNDSSKRHGPSKSNIRPPYVYSPIGDHRNSMPICSHTPPGCSSHMYPHSIQHTYMRMATRRVRGNTYPLIRPESFKLQGSPFNTDSGPSLKRRLDHSNTIVFPDKFLFVCTYSES